MEKKCPRCSTKFRCRVDRTEICNCRKLSLAVGVRDYIKDNFEECICINCLKTVNESFNLQGINPKFQIIK